MIPKAFQDDRAVNLLTRVREDISHLRQDLGNLVNHTTRQTLPRGARELADNARLQLEQGRRYAVKRFRRLGRNGHPSPETVGLLGGAILVGVIAAGVWLFLRGSQHPISENEEEEDGVDPGNGS